MFDKVTKNRFGFYNLKEIPSPKELQAYYTEKYYQDPKGSYEKKYSEAELQFINNKIEQKYHVISNILELKDGQGYDFLDVGCGEGWALNFFQKKYWNVLGLDYSEFGCKEHNPSCFEKMRVGNINDNLDLYIREKRKFTVIWIVNVLEHVADPLGLLERCNKLINNQGVMVVEVPNDFSVMQQYLFNHGYISKSFWIASPDHISYFNNKGLIAICNEAGWDCHNIMGNFPIDLNLFNENTNYINNPQVGKSCHKARVEIENFLHEISCEKTVALYSAIAELGLGREIIGFFKKK